MIKPLLGVVRYIIINGLPVEFPQSSVVAVGLNRQKIAEITREKGIPVKDFANKLGLTRSRYYRWVNNESDLPFEYTFGIKKWLGLSDVEFLELISPTTDELIQTLVLSSYYSSSDNCPSKRHTLMRNMVKHEKSAEKSDPFRLIALYLHIVDAIQINKPIVSFVMELEKYLGKLENFTDFDLFISMTLLQIKVSLHEKDAFRGLIMPQKKLFRGLSKSGASTKMQSFGFLVDIVIGYLEYGYYNKAEMILKEMKDTMQRNKTLDNYSRFLITQLLNICKDSTRTFDKLIVALKKCEIVPEEELNFWNQINY